MLASAGAGLALDAGLVARVAAQAACTAPDAAGELLGTVPLHGDRPFETPFGELLGGPGHDARLFTDLSGLDTGRLITSTDRVFVRTTAPPALAAHRGPWVISTGGLVSRPAPLDAAALRSAARPMGPHLIECSGNNDPNNFGLLSVAEWTGVPLAEVLERLGPLPSAAAVLVSGLDDEASTSTHSVPGASWVLPIDEAARLGVFLATGMNGGPLTADHGDPVRLAVPGWYGCAWIKWVRDIRIVGADEPVTSQMAEFARRTHQPGRPALARDYEAPAIDLAATPVRVERRRVDGRLEYRVVGIAWGGDRVPDRIEIRFGTRDPWRPVDLCPAPSAPKMWSLWTIPWRPESPGTYSIALRSADASVRTRRLDLFYYVRRVRIDEV